MALALQQAKTTIKTTSGLDGIAGLWLIAAPFILGYSNIASATWNDMIFGAAVVLLAGSRTVGEGYRMAWPSWINVLIGLWLIIAPFVLAYPTDIAATANSIIMGIIIGILAVWSALATPAELS